jgi:arylsulfatase A-like enzyme
MNTILLTIDALRVDHISCYGYDRTTTPNIDVFAKENTKFTSAYSNGTFTSSAIPALLTGSYRKESESPLEMNKDLQINSPNIASVLRDADVKTVGINTNTLLAIWYSEINGFDEFMNHVPNKSEIESASSTSNNTDGLLKSIFRPLASQLGVKSEAKKIYNQFFVSDAPSTAYHNAESVTDKILETIKNNKNIFIWGHYMDPHEPYDYLDVLDKDFLKTDTRDTAPEEIKQIVNRASNEPESILEHERRLLIDLYDAYIHYFDRHFGRLIDHLKKSGEYADTQIIVTSDHGEEFGEHGKYFHFNKPYDELIHVPLLTKCPIIELGTLNEQVSHVDIAPTIAESYNVELPGTDGESLSGNIEDRKVVTFGTDRPYLDVSSKPFAALRYPDRKIIYNYSGDDELYFLDEDPNEKHNQVENYTNEYSQLLSELMHFINLSDSNKANLEAKTHIDETEGIKQQLDDLGYLE